MNFVEAADGGLLAKLAVSKLPLNLHVHGLHCVPSLISLAVVNLGPWACAGGRRTVGKDALIIGRPGQACGEMPAA